MQRGAAEAKSTTATRETSLKPGPVRQGTTDNGLKGVTNGTVKLSCGSLDITWRSCSENKKETLGRARHK